MNKTITLKLGNSKIIKTVDNEETPIIFSNKDINKLLQKEVVKRGTNPTFSWSIEYSPMPDYELSAENVFGEFTVNDIISKDIVIDSSALYKGNNNDDDGGDTGSGSGGGTTDPDPGPGTDPTPNPGVTTNFKPMLYNNTGLDLSICFGYGATIPSSVLPTNIQSESTIRRKGMMQSSLNYGDINTNYISIQILNDISTITSDIYIKFQGNGVECTGEDDKNFGFKYDRNNTWANCGVRFKQGTTNSDYTITIAEVK